MRLAKFIATAGVASRRSAEKLVKAGRVSVDGRAALDPALDVSSSNAVAVDGQPIHVPDERVVLALNKPLGVVSSAADPQGRPTVVSLVSAGVRVYPVGRLDIDTTGLILLTNDGDLAHRLSHPKFGVEKTYKAIVSRAPVSSGAIDALRKGVELEDGRTAPARVGRLAPDTLELTLTEGRNRQVRRMCEHVGHPVRRLERTRFGALELGSLKSGHYRRLNGSEVSRLQETG
jgi:23S rRNA pseudouridine2605 synthase